MLSDLRIRLRALFRRKRVEAELNEELRFHLERQTEKYIKSGITPEEAARRARIELGGVEQAKEEHRDARGVRFLEDTWRDIAYAARMLRKSPGFTIVAVLTLALGIGANTAIFSVTYAMLIKSLPFSNPSNLMQIWATRGPGQQRRSVYLSAAEYEAVSRGSSAFSQVAFYSEGGCDLESPTHATSLQASVVSGDFFSTLGVQPLLGRPLIPTDEEAGHDHVAVLSEKLWRGEFHGDPNIIGKEIELRFTGAAGIRGTSYPLELYKVVGVLPKIFPFPNAGKIFIPYPAGSGLVSARPLQAIAIGRLKDGVRLKQANAELHTVAQRLIAEGQSPSKQFDLRASNFRNRITQGYRAETWVLFGAAGFVLLLVFVNTGALLLARAPMRSREVAVRHALGATRYRLLRQLLSESLLLSLIGGGLGVLLAYLGMHALLAIAPAGTPRLNEVRLSLPILLYALVISCVGGLSFGFAPALHSTRAQPGAALAHGSDKFAGTVPLRRFQQKLLVIGEISLALILAVGSALMIRSLWNLTGTNLGYGTDRVLTTWVQFSRSECATVEACQAARGQKFRRALESVRSVPGVEDAAFSIWRPLSSPFESRLRIEGSTRIATVQFQAVSPDYFHTLGIPLLGGRTFTSQDIPDAPRVAIVGRSLAERFFNGRPLGKRVSVSRDKSGRPIWLEVVGEVGSTRDQNPRAAPRPAIYLPLTQTGPFGESALLVRTAVDPSSVAKAVSAAVWAADTGATLTGTETINRILENFYAGPQFRAILLGSFAALGLLLAVIGIYGVTSCVAAERTHELAVRVAVGASPREMLLLVLREGALLAGVGILLGVGASAGVTRLLRSFTYGISPTDPATLAGVAVVVAFATVGACIIPARRAMRIDPAEALRHE